MNENAHTYPVSVPSGSARANVGNLERGLSVASGVLMAANGLRRRNLSGLLSTAIGSMMIYRGLSGRCEIKARLLGESDESLPAPVEVEVSAQLPFPPSQVYDAWRRLENLPKFLQHLESVHALDHKRSVWKARGPGGIGRFSWEAEIVEDVYGERIAWVSLPGGSVDNAGEVRFKQAPGNGTEMEARISYRPPAAYVGSQLGRWLNPAFARMLRADLESFREAMAEGQFATAGGLH